MELTIEQALHQAVTAHIISCNMIGPTIDRAPAAGSCSRQRELSGCGKVCFPGFQEIARATGGRAAPRLSVQGRVHGATVTGGPGISCGPRDDLRRRDLS